MVVRHPKYIIRLLHQFVRQHAAARAGDVNPQLPQRPDGVDARRLPINGPDPGGQNPIILALPDGVLEKSSGHRAAANISGANK